MPPPEYRPPGESDADIFAEHCWLQGAVLAAVAYGMESILFFMSIHLLWVSRKRAGGRPGRNLGLIIYISIMYLLGTLYMVGLLQFTQEAFIDGRNIPGGPNAYQEEMFSIPIDMLANVIMVLLTWMCDIINVWRCIVIFRGSRIPLWVVITIPVLMYFASVALGMLFLKQVGTPAASPWDAFGINWTIPYYTMSLALNIIVTILIVARLLLHRRRVRAAMGPGHADQYTSLAAMIVESAAIYSSFSILFLVPFAASSALAPLFLQSLSPVQVVSSMLIIFRVAQGKGWNSKTLATTTEGASATIGGSKKSSRIRIRTVTDTFATDTTPHGRDADAGTFALKSLQTQSQRGESPLQDTKAEV